MVGRATRRRGGPARRRRRSGAPPRAGEPDVADAFLTRPLSRTLTRRVEDANLELGRRTYAEVFLTDARGEIVALSHRTSDYIQDDEDWWQRAVRDEVYTGDVEYDASAKTYSCDLCFAIRDREGALLGGAQGRPRDRRTRVHCAGSGRVPDGRPRAPRRLAHGGPAHHLQFVAGARSAGSARRALRGS